VQKYATRAGMPTLIAVQESNGSESLHLVDDPAGERDNEKRLLQGLDISG
jgi:hypothetical protein